MMTYSAIIIELDGELYRTLNPDDPLVEVAKWDDGSWDDWDSIPQPEWKSMVDQAGDEVYNRE